MAVHYPADVEIFAIVRNESAKCGHPDKKVMQMANDRLQKTNPDYPEFIGTPEHVDTITAILDLEQLIGKDITWVTSFMTFDELCRWKKAIPNQMKRFCTTWLKIDPIFWHCFLRYEFVKMRCGFRADEAERALTFSTKYKYPIHQNNYGKRQNKWETVEWREGEFNLIDDLVFHPQVQRFWESKNITFPPDSNCQMCFWKNPQQLKQNFSDSPNVMEWAKGLEKEIMRTFKDVSLSDIERIPIQYDFAFGGGSGCQAGFCTD